MSGIDEQFTFTVQGVCEATGLSRTRIMKAMKDGDLDSFKAGKVRLIRRQAVKKYLDLLEERSAGDRSTGEHDEPRAA